MCYIIAILIKLITVHKRDAPDVLLIDILVS